MKLKIITLVKEQAMDKSWISLDDRTRPEYEKGVQEFLEFAYSSIEPHEKIRCPCVRCNNVYFHNRDHVEADLFEHGFIKHYVSWVLHGEEFVDSSTEDSDSYDEDSELEDEHKINNMHESYNLIWIWACWVYSYTNKQPTT
ncbi:hypothetical protein ACJIZ3_006202 [Penstemon smallii]|uniref:Transposase-associated domain-containing protein n=1 Tax=Penstemon smallii TaxID=265156 RepID=A0ABD3S7E1_9LAMI